VQSISGKISNYVKANPGKTSQEVAIGTGLNALTVYKHLTGVAVKGESKNFRRQKVQKCDESGVAVLGYNYVYFFVKNGDRYQIPERDELTAAFFGNCV
jgi:hypothetical protein